MQKKTIIIFTNLIIFIYLFFKLSTLIYAQTPTPQEKYNFGIIKGIWFSKEPFFEGETIRIYSAIQNQSGYDIRGKVGFFINGKQIGTSNFSVLNDRLIEVWTDWVATGGEVDIETKIIYAEKCEIGKGCTPIFPFIAATKEKEKFIDKDTDGDGIGNKQDPDDDNDGLPDEEELIIGTNPLIKDTDGDGVVDGQEIKKYKTDPLNKDTDGDGIEDGKEVNTYKTDPLKKDTDGDGIDDKDEIKTYYTDPLNPDTDGDGIDDFVESKITKTNPLIPNLVTTKIPTKIIKKRKEEKIPKQPLTRRISQYFKKKSFEISKKIAEKLRKQKEKLEKEKQKEKLPPYLEKEITKIEKKIPVKIPRKKIPNFEKILTQIKILLLESAIKFVETYWYFPLILLLLLLLIILRILKKIFFDDE